MKSLLTLLYAILLPHFLAIIIAAKPIISEISHNNLYSQVAEKENLANSLQVE